ncbi:MAG TPA: cation:proton antiporter [Actinocrinis sp.]|nr:cation:proton antiporter [Actinospica sp.]HEU5426820.1 cation:proton antiporter [Actinocrinis sp.]
MTTVQTAGRPGAGRGILIGAALIAVPVGLILAALAFGAARNPGAAAASPAAASAVSADPYPRLLIALPVILAACYLLAVLSRRLGQPAVIGEIVAGVLLGPSLLGSIWPGAFHWLLPDGVASIINTLAQIGLIFFMFLVGAELDLTAARRRGRTVLAVSQVGIALPVLAGIVLAVWLYPAFGARVGFPGFALFIAVSMSVTAFPVLARILTDRHLAETPLGALALTCAAVGDVAAWCLLGAVVAISRGGSAGRVVATIALAALFAAAMVWVVRPLLARWLGAVRGAAVLPIMLGGIMLSALATNDIGVHPIFGAFLFGAVMPRTAPRIRKAAESMQSVTVALLLPLFFVYTGLHTRFGLLGTNGRLWAWCALITAVAVLVKTGSTAAAARLTGLGPRDSLSLGAMMNCRGLTELVVLNVGLQLKVISPTVFAMLVIMTLVSTVATAPALSAIARWRSTGVEP